MKLRAAAGRITLSKVNRWAGLLYVGTACVFVVMLGAAASPAPAPEEYGDWDRQLESEKRLQRTVDIDETGVPLDELLRKAGGGGVVLACSRSCASQKVQVRLRRRL